MVSRKAKTVEPKLSSPVFEDRCSAYPWFIWLIYLLAWYQVGKCLQRLMVVVLIWTCGVCGATRSLLRLLPIGPAS